MTRPLDAELDDRFESPHTGIPRPPQPVPKIPAAKPVARVLPPHHDDPPYWILQCGLKFKPLAVQDIARLTGMTVEATVGYLEVMKAEGIVDEVDGVWVRVKQRD